ncbi:C2H2 transcription factor [Diplocarpon rosae]|nr:C2H2 transcription factor [Diplocarpon rosae]
MTARPKMHARNSSGRKVSLLNDDPSYEEPPQEAPVPLASAYSPYAPAMLRSYSTTSAQSRTSSPLVPELIRADSFDSSNPNDPLSPITPTSKDFGRPSSDGGAKAPAHFEITIQVHRETHNCDKTFTTSGHASRHSKIHTAEKGVVCTWPGCQKKFTRGDNMKQHLETHTKDRARAAAAHKPAAAAARTLTMPAGVRKPGAVDARASRPSSRNPHPAMEYPVDPALYRPQPGPAPYGSLAAPAYHGSPRAARRDSMPTGLDALADIAAGTYYRS